MPLPKKETPSGAPEWVVTYGDMMSLLLCFFILLAALANFDKQDKMMMATIESIREAFGAPGQHGWMLDPQLDLNALDRDLFHIQRTKYSKQKGESEDEGVVGPDSAVRALRRVDEYQVDRAILFDRFSTELSDEARAALDVLAENIRGHRSKIELRGHCSNEPIPPSICDGDPMLLSMRRARAVADHLVARGVEPARIRVSAAGPHEPAVIHAYTPADQELNHRVELFIYPHSIDVYTEAATDAAAPE